jgi:hypothetical protein
MSFLLTGGSAFTLSLSSLDPYLTKAEQSVEQGSGHTPLGRAPQYAVAFTGHAAAGLNTAGQVPMRAGASLRRLQGCCCSSDWDAPVRNSTLVETLLLMMPPGFCAALNTCPGGHSCS